MDKKMYGKIKWYKKEKGYGYIIGYDEELYFFELANCVNFNETFEANEEVLFVPNWGDMDFASSVEKVGVNNGKIS